MKTLPNDIFFSYVESEIAAGKSVRFKVKGNSMFPLLRNEKDEVVLSPITSTPEKMDIVLFRFNGKHVLHRIIDIKGDTYIIQGDGIYMSSEHCTRKDIVGTVTVLYKVGWRPITTKSGLYKLFSALWLKLRFCRRYLLAILRRIYK